MNNPAYLKQPNWTSNICRLVLLTLAMFCPQVVHAQNDTFTPLGLKPGSPAGSYGLSAIDTVSLFNGRVNVRIPLVSIPGRGQANSQVSFTWDSPARWQVYKSYDLNGTPIYSAGRGGGNPDGSVNFGWRYGSHHVYPQGVGKGEPSYCGVEGFYAWSEKTLTRMFWVEPDGTEHEMRDVLTGGQPLGPTACWSQGPNRGRIFVSTDGSGATFILDSDVHDGIYVNMEYPHGQGWEAY